MYQKGDKIFVNKTFPLDNGAVWSETILFAHAFPVWLALKELHTYLTS